MPPTAVTWVGSTPTTRPSWSAWIASTRELFAWRAVDALRAAPTAWGSDPVLFYGFDDLDGVQRDAVQTLAGPAGAAVTVSLTYEAGREALAARAETVEALRPVAAEVETLGPQDDHYADGSRTVLHHLERHLFAVGAPRLEPSIRAIRGLSGR